MQLTYDVNDHNNKAQAISESNFNCVKKRRRGDKDDGIFLEKVAVKMVEMKMAESDNKSGRTQREKRG